jgi:hypothetical protein
VKARPCPPFAMNHLTYRSRHVSSFIHVGLSTRNTDCVLKPGAAVAFCVPIRNTELAPTGGVCSKLASDLPLVASVIAYVVLVEGMALQVEPSVNLMLVAVTLPFALSEASAVSGPKLKSLTSAEPFAGLVKLRENDHAF